MATKPLKPHFTLGQTVAESILLHRPELTEAERQLIRRMQKRNYRPKKQDIRMTTAIIARITLRRSAH
jgi:hypothetical protein